MKVETQILQVISLQKENQRLREENQALKELDFALIRSVISTARKQGRNILEILTQLLNGKNVVFV